VQFIVLPADYPEEAEGISAAGVIIPRQNFQKQKEYGIHFPAAPLIRFFSMTEPSASESSWIFKQ
jgi:hypothetical protein